MLLRPVKEKLSVRYPELLEVLHESNERPHDGIVDPNYLKSMYQPFYRCDDYNQSVSKLIALAATRMEGYYLPGTDMPYIICALQIWQRVELLEETDEHKLAAFAWFLIAHKFAANDEIRVICGDYVANLLIVRKDKEDDDIFDYLNPLQLRFVQHENIVLLRILRGLREEHDSSLWEKMGKMCCCVEQYEKDCENCHDRYYCYDDEDCYDERRYYKKNDCDGLECVIDEKYAIEDKKRGKNITSDPINLYYQIDGYCYRATIKKGEIDDWTTEEVLVNREYTPEFMAYCDRSRDLFWKRFGLEYEEVERLLDKIFPEDKFPSDDELNDVLYEWFD